MNEKEMLLEALDRLNRTTDELGRIKRALEAVQQGIPFNEAYDEELYSEASVRSDGNRATSYVTVIIVHLFKLKYGDNIYGHSNLLDEIEEARKQITIITKWDAEDRDLNIVKHTDAPLAYIRARNEFKRILEKNPKEYRINVDYIRKIPIDSPWSLKQLMDDDPNELIENI